MISFLRKASRWARTRSIACQPREQPFIPLNSALLGTVLATCIVLSPFTPVFAAPTETAPGATIESVRSWLIANNPQLQALQLETDAAEASVYPRGALPDPVASIALRGIDRSSPSLLPGNVGSAVYQVRQRFPLWGKRRIAREVAQG